MNALALPDNPRTMLLELSVAATSSSPWHMIAGCRGGGSNHRVRKPPPHLRRRLGLRRLSFQIGCGDFFHLGDIETAFVDRPLTSRRPLVLKE